MKNNIILKGNEDGNKLVVRKSETKARKTTVEPENAITNSNRVPPYAKYITIAPCRLSVEEQCFWAVQLTGSSDKIFYLSLN